MTLLYNANTRSAYQAGCYNGSFTIGEILSHGDTGLGSLEGNDGEFVIDRGVAWRTDHRFVLTGELSKPQFEAALGERIPLTNRTWGLRIAGAFRRVTAGASARQHSPTRALARVMEDYTRPTWTDVAGTLVGFHCPVYLTGIDYVGGHYHWLSDDKAHGGHVFDFTTSDVTVEACEAVAYTTELPTDPEFYAIDLSPYN
jgi:acetolactate decarboxylase